MNDLQNTGSGPGQQQVTPPPKRSCASCLFGLFMSGNFLLMGILVVVPLMLLTATAEHAAMAVGIFALCFFWQRSAARKGCFMPIIILALLLVAELFAFAILTDFGNNTYGKINHEQLKQMLDEVAPGLYANGRAAFAKLGAWSKQALQKGVNTAQNALSRLGQSDEDKKLAMLEEAFSNYPGDPAVVLALADAYMTRNDLASTRLAIALYEALVETDPCDAFLARLADAYGKIFRYDLAFATAVRRAWLPHAMLERAARQIALTAVLSGDLPRGIFELEKILQLDPVESEEIMLLLAGLYQDIGNKEQAKTLLDQVIARTPAGLSVAKTAVAARQALGN